MNVDLTKRSETSMKSANLKMLKKIDMPLNLCEYACVGGKSPVANTYSLCATQMALHTPDKGVKVCS